MTLKNKSNSRRNLAKRIAAEIFTTDERLHCNVNGKQGKPSFDPKRMEKVKKAVLTYWPLEPKETMDRAWKECVTAIDEANRGLKRQVLKQEKRD